MCTRCGYEVPGIVLLHDCSKDMSVHISTYTIYDFSALTQVVWKLWHW